MGALEKLTTGKTPFVVIVVCIIASVAYLVFSGGSKGDQEDISAYASERVLVPFTCDACGHEWEQYLEESIVCPKCGELAIGSNSYKCPRCLEEFMGLQYQKVGMGKFKCRVPGGEWKNSPPNELTCPHCKYTSRSHYANAVGGLQGRQ